MTTATVPMEDMRGKLLSLDDARNRLSATEPLSEVTFPLRGPDNSVARFKLESGWNTNLDAEEGTAPVQAFVTVGGVEYQMTKDAVLEATSLIGLPKKYMMRAPANLMQPHLDYWFRNGPESGVIGGQEEMKLLAMGNTVYAFAKASVEPYSNVRLLDDTLARIEAKYGEGEVFVDYKFHHDLRRTALRIIVPESARNIREDDPWSMGIQIRNSLSGEKPLSLEGYLFRYWCTNGSISTHARSGRWSRRSGGTEEAYEWAQHAVDEILGGLEHEFEAVEQLSNAPLEDDVNQVLDDLFSTYSVPLAAREHIIEQMVNSSDLTMYGVMQAVTSVANRDDMAESARETLMEIGGDLPRAHSDRCNACRRIMR